ncbi:hypothetical protein DFH08DRAFT_953691 [Mycena albidolilacea]|uniref:Uncharacterized protein n=1 Tax=Mycena albidolilacea TaxID=1033008 RepID=A0AAD7AH89_9AGAR|nr:hypothetical protein DFH08DRAFT_953691 [Mycena albidolilacea]
MVCDLPFVSHGNYKNDNDHDQNTWKFWYLVFGVGLFTAQKDAVGAAAGGVDSVHVFLTRDQATRAWGRWCQRHHKDGYHKTLDARESDADFSDDNIAEAKREAKRDVVKREPVRPSPNTPARNASAPVRRMPVKLPLFADDSDDGHHSVRVKRNAPSPTKALKRGSPRKAPNIEKTMLESDDDDIFASDSSVEAPLMVAGAQPRSRSAALSPLTEDEDVPMPPSESAAMSTTVSSTSSLSATSTTFSSISGAIRRPAASVARGSSSTVPVVAPIPTAPVATPSALMLYNRRTRVLYDDPKEAVREKQCGDSMQVVEVADVVEWISGLRK